MIDTLSGRAELLRKLREYDAELEPVHQAAAELEQLWGLDDQLAIQATDKPFSIYLAGPMSGIPDFNFPAFNAKAAELRALGYTVVNPAEFHTHTDKSWEWYMKYAIQELLKCDAIYLLSGFHTSRGAMLEYDIANQLRMPSFLPSFSLPKGLL